MPTEHSRKVQDVNERTNEQLIDLTHKTERKKTERKSSVDRELIYHIITISASLFFPPHLNE